MNDNTMNLSTLKEMLDNLKQQHSSIYITPESIYALVKTIKSFNITIKDWNALIDYLYVVGKVLDATYEVLPALAKVLDNMDAILQSDDPDLDTIQEIVTYLKENKEAVQEILNKKVNISDIVDNLTSAVNNKPLSANQGKVLKDLIDHINDVLSSGDTDLNTLQELANAIKLNKSNIENKVNVTDIIDNLTSTEINKPLSAKQGKILDEKIATTNTSITNAINTAKGYTDDEIAELSNVYQPIGNYQPLGDYVTDTTFNTYKTSITEVFSNVYRKSETYPKEDLYTQNEVNTLISTLATKVSLQPVLNAFPTDASNDNKLASIGFVNSSISTATATFRGTFENLNDLYATNGDDNDYAFYKRTVKNAIVFDRYKWSREIDETTNSHWKFEYELNNSSFTEEQFLALNSGVTASLLTTTNTRITDLETDMSTVKQNKVDKVTGKGLSTNDFTDAYKNAVDNSIQEGDTRLTDARPTSDTFSFRQTPTIGAVVLQKNGTDYAKVNVSLPTIPTSLVKSNLANNDNGYGFGTCQINNTNPSGLSGAYQWGTYVSFAQNDGRFELYAPHTGTDSDHIYARTGWDDDRKNWEKLAFVKDIPTKISQLPNDERYAHVPTIGNTIKIRLGAVENDTSNYSDNYTINVASNEDIILDGFYSTGTSEDGDILDIGGIGVKAIRNNNIVIITVMTYSGQGNRQYGISEIYYHKVTY